MSSVLTFSRAPIAGLGLLALAVGLASSAVSAPRVRLKCTVSPRQLPSAGGQVHILVSSGGVPLDAAFATLIGPSRRPITEELTPTDAIGQFQTFVDLPENEGRAAQTYSVRIFARGEADYGHTVGGGTIRVKGSTEVDPLVITSCEATPRQLPASGGSFQVAARITGLRRGLVVKAHVLGVGVDVQPQMTFRAGAFRVAVPLPANTSAMPSTYEVRVIATPADGEPVDADCGSVAVAPPDPTAGIAVTGVVRGLPVLRLFRDGNTTPVKEYFPFDAGLEGTANVAAGDLNGDGSPDFVLAAGPGAPPLVRLARGIDLESYSLFHAYAPTFTGGVNVAVGDVNGDGRGDVITGAGEGSSGGHVKVFDGSTGALLLSFLAYDTAFTGGVRVAAGDVNGDGRADIITGAGPGATPHVKVFSGANQTLLRSFFAFAPTFAGGVNVAAGDVNGDGKADVIAGSGPGATPHVKVFSGANGSELRSFLAYDSTFRGGVSVATADLDGDGRADVITGGGSGATGGHVKVFSGASGAEIRSFLPYDSGFNGGVSVAGVGAVNLPQPQ